MDELVWIQPEHVERLSNLMIGAYPGLNINTLEKQKAFQERILSTQFERGNVNYYGLFRDGALVGGMRFHDFRMNMLSQTVNAGGVGFVAVDLMRKKEQVGKELIYRFLQHYDARETSMALLYAFRTDFYHRMGFGFGGKMHQYQIPTSRLPKGPSKRGVHLLTIDDLVRFQAYYDRVVSRVHGMLEKQTSELSAMLTNPNQCVVAYIDREEIEGCMVFHFKPHQPTNFGSNDIVVTEMFYDNPAALSELMTFLHSQADQIRTVVINTQDDDFHHLVPDARNQSDTVIPHVYHETNTSGVGLMYRVVNTRRLFRDLRDHNFNDVTCTVKLNITDDFYPANHGSTVVRFTNGASQVLEGEPDFDVEVAVNVADFSSAIMGVVPFIRLIRYGRAHVSNERYMSHLNRLFAWERPVCTAGF